LKDKSLLNAMIKAGAKRIIKPLIDEMLVIVVSDEEWEKRSREKQLAEKARIAAAVKPCTCGGKAGVMNTCMWPPFGNWFIVTCIDCHKTGPNKYHGRSGMIKAVKEWNEMVS